MEAWPDYDAFLLVSFGGPEGPDDVMPFLQNVTRGRGIPPARLEAVAEHYYAVGGVSPINQQCRDLIAAIGKDFAAAGVDLPIYWGNRNWDPYLTETVAEMASRRGAPGAGLRHLGLRVLLQLPAVPGGHRAGPGRGRAGGPADRQDPALLQPPGVHRAVRRRHRAPPSGRCRPASAPGVPLVFTAHSVPDAMAAASGPPPGGRYPAQLAEAAGLIAGRVTAATGREHPWRLVYQSRSGPPSQPWLGPDVCDYLEDLARDGAPGAVLVPVGFITDHMEVIHDLDVEAAETARRLGLPLARAATPGTDPRFVAMITALVSERLDEPRQPGRAGLPGLRLRRLLPPARRGRAPGRPRPPRRPRHERRGRGTGPGSPAHPGPVGGRRGRGDAGGPPPGRPQGRPEVAGTKSSPTDVVTEMDRAAEAMIAERILAERPGDAFLGEEGGESGHGRVRWIVDPLDGTINYIYGLPDWAVSIAAEVDGVVVAGVVVVPRQREVFTAVAGQGSWLHPDGARAVPLRCNTGVPLPDALVSTGFGYDAGPAGGAGRDRGRRCCPQVRDIRRGGSCAVDLCSLAAGRVDAYYERGVNYWDWAAGGLIAAEAGARVAGLAGRPPSPGLTIAAGPGLFEDLHDLLRSLDPERDAEEPSSAG